MSTRLEIKTILALHYLNSEDVRAGEAGKMAEATLNDLIHELAERIRDLGGIWSSEDVMSVADAIDPKSREGR